MRRVLLASGAVIAALALARPAFAQPVNDVADGSSQFYLNGYAQTSVGAFSVSGPSHAHQGNAGSSGWVRINPGFDAATASGLDYGARLEFWNGFSTMQTKQNGAPQTNLHVDSIYLRRGYGYLGTAGAGYVRLGLTDSAFTLLQTGVIESFGDGGQWTLDGGVRDMLPANAAPVRGFVYADQVSLYATPKLVYISPSFSGVKFAAGYEPDSTNLSEADDECMGANSACLGPNATDSRGPGRERKNTVDAAVQYQTNLQDVQVKAMAGILYGSPAGDKGTGAPAVPGGYNALQVYQAGLQLSYAGLTFGANLKGGNVEDGYAFAPRGARKALGYSIGASYAIGPVVAGVSYFNSQSAGTYVPGSAASVAPTLSEYGIAAGGNYLLDPRISLFAQYMYGHRHQPGNTALGPDGDSQAQVIAGGAAFKW